MSTKKYALSLKSDFESDHFFSSFFDKIVSKTQNNFFKQIEAWHKPKKIISSSKIKFHNIWKKNLQQLRLFLKSYDSFLIFLIFRFLGVLPNFSFKPLYLNNWSYPPFKLLYLNSPPLVKSFNISWRPKEGLRMKRPQQRTWLGSRGLTT